MNNKLLEMLLNATTGNLPADSAASIPRWPGPDPIAVQVQSIFYTTLCASLLSSFLAMLGKKWLNQYRENAACGSAMDRSRMRERKLAGIENWKLHAVLESLPLILQFALILLGFGLSRYLWEFSRSVSSVVIGFTSFGLLFYMLISTVSIFSPYCPFQTPFSLLVRFAVSSAPSYWQNLRQRFRSKQPPHESRAVGARPDLPLPKNDVGEGHDLEANTTASDIVPAPIVPLFPREIGAESDELDARCITRLLVMTADTDVVIPTMDFIPEIIWHGGITDVPLKAIYGTLKDCFNFPDPHPVVVPKSRDIAYLSARAFAHVAFQRRCITQYEEHKQDDWKALCLSHRPLSPTDCGSDFDLKTVLLTVDMTLGYDNGFPWKQAQMTSSHRAWMSHVFLYRAWHEGQSMSEVVMDFVENSMSLRLPSDIVITDCLIIIGLMIGVPVHPNDITVRDKRLDLNSF